MPPGEQRVAQVQFVPRAALPKTTPGGKEQVQQGMLVLGSTGAVHLLGLTADSATCLGTLTPGAQAVVSMCASHSGAHAALATSDGSVFLYDMQVCISSFFGKDTSRARSKLLTAAFPGSPSTAKHRSKVMPLLRKQTYKNANRNTQYHQASSSRAASAGRTKGAVTSKPTFKWQRAGPPGHVNTAPSASTARSVRVPGRGSVPLAKVDSNRAGRRKLATPGGVSGTVPPAASVSINAANSMPAGTNAALQHGNARDYAMAHLRNTVAVACGEGRGGGLPPLTRLDAWRLALALPGNTSAFEGCSALLLPNMQDSIMRQARVSSPRLERQLRLCLACLVQWCPDLGQVSHLAETSFPFVRMWGVDGTAAAESCMVFWGTWGRRWLETAPLPPLPLLGAAWTVLEQNDAELADHLLRCGADAGVTLWPMLRGLLSDVLGDGDWCAVWDMLAMFVADPALLPLAAVAIVTLMRTTLLSIPPAAHAPPKGEAAKEWTAAGRQVDPACPQTATVARLLSSVTPLRAKDVLLRMWKLRRLCKGGLLAVLQGEESAWGCEGPPPIGEGGAGPQATHSTHNEQLHTRKDGLVLSKVVVHRPVSTHSSSSASPYTAPPAEASKVWVPHPEGGLGSMPRLVLPKADQYAPLPGGYLPVAHVQHEQQMWQAIQEAEDATLARKAAAAALQSAAEEAQAAAAVERASGVTAAGAAARRVAHLQGTMQLQQQQREAIESQTRRAKVAAETALHTARRDLISARNAAAAAAASASDERAVTAAADWNAFATQGMAAEDANANRLAAELQLVQEQHSSVRDQVLTSQLAAESVAARSRRLQQIAVSSTMRAQDEAEEATYNTLQREASRIAGQQLQFAAAEARSQEERSQALTGDVAMAGIQRQRMLRLATTQAHTQAGAQQTHIQARVTAAPQADLQAAQEARALAERRVAQLQAEVDSLKEAQQAGGDETGFESDEDDTTVDLASQSDVDRAVEAAVWRSAAALTTRPSVSQDVSPAQGTPVMPAGSPETQRTADGDVETFVAGTTSAGLTGEPSGTRGVRHTPVKSEHLGATQQRRLPARSPFAVELGAVSAPAVGDVSAAASTAQSSQGSGESEEDWMASTVPAWHKLSRHALQTPPGMATFHAGKGARLRLKRSPLSATQGPPLGGSRRVPSTDIWTDLDTELGGDDTEGSIEVDSLGGTFEGGSIAATGGVIPRQGTSAHEAEATADVAQLVARYTLAIQGQPGAYNDSAGSSAGENDASGSEAGSADVQEGGPAAEGGAVSGLRYQPLEDESDEEYNEERAAADMAMQAAALGSDMFSPGAGYYVSAAASPQDGQWLDSSSGSGSGSSDAEATFESLLATSLSPVPEGVPKYAAEAAEAPPSRRFLPPPSVPPQPKQSGALHFGVAIMDAAGSFQDDVDVQDGQWVQRTEQQDFLSGSVGSGEVVREHLQHVKDAVRNIESTRERL